MPRIAVLGQKDALVRALYELAQLGRSHPLDVIVLVPSPQGPVLHGADVHGACGAFGFQRVVAETDDVVLKELRAFAPDLIVSILWPRRVLQEVLELCTDCINFHPSLLPRHRGSLTQFWAIFDGDEEAGATCHRMVREFDAGRILEQVAVPVAPDETALSLSVKIAGAIEQCFKKVIRIYLQPDGLPEGRLWDVKEFPYHFRKLPRAGEIDPEWPEDKVERFVRAMYFPPHRPARVRGPGGVDYLVQSMEDYRAALAGRAPPPPPTTAAAPSSGPGAERKAAKSPGPAMQALPWVAALVAMLIAVTPLAIPGWLSEEARRAGGREKDPSSGSSSLPDPNVAVRHTLPESSRARCLDGSPVSYYVAPGANAGDRSRWLLYFQGGGWCAEAPALVHRAGYSHDLDVGHPDLCTERSKGYHGSSRDDRPTRSLRDRGFLSGDASVNPLMHDWHRVIFRNCDGALFMSGLDAPLESNGSLLHFRGRDGVLAVLDALLERHSLDSAEEVVISGCSAGGVAAVLLADLLRERLEARVRGGRVFVAVLSDSSLFPEWPGRPPPGVLSFPQFEWLFANANLSGSVPVRCLESGLSWRCVLVGVALPFVTTPVFLLQSAADSWQVRAPLSDDALPSLAAQIRGAVLPSLRPPHGGAIDSCFHHCEQWGRIHFGGQSNVEAFARWYKARRRRWAAGAVGAGAPGEGAGAPAEGWPLVHVAEPWAEGCYEGQRRHREWHRRLQRIAGE